MVSARILTTALAIGLHALAVIGAPNCPLQGPVFPRPVNPSTDPTLQDAFRNLTATFTQRDQDNSTGADSMTYSVEVFSVADDKPIWSWYHTAPTLPSNTTGVKKADGDTVYRLGSLTKVFSIYTWLAEVGDAHFNEPVSKYVPEVAALAAAADAKKDPVNNVDWNSVTIGSIAAQLTGLVRDYAQVGEITQEYNQSVAMALGFPPLPNASIPTCGEWPLCNRTQFFEGMKHTIPSYPPSQTATYSDLSWLILGYALETITGKKFQDMLENDVLKPLGLEHTFLFAPNETLGAIPSDKSRVQWYYSLGDTAPAGNMYSSTRDISAFGRAILRSAQLSPAQTRRWLKPASLTSELVAGVGYPWGVRRVPLPVYANGKRVVDAYNKAGSISAWRSLLVLLPDYGVGFAALFAGDKVPANTNFNVADALAAALLPALEKASREQADRAFAGVYEAPQEAALNSSVVVSTQADRPGLGIDSWVSNGTDMKAVAVALQTGYRVSNPSIRMYPTDLETVNEDGSKRVAFKAVFEDLDAPSRNTMMSTDCGTWVSQTGAVYGETPLDQFVFNIDKNGKVTSLEPLALRVQLKKH
ncbi:uncharacterized protein E0L32_000387 [Thyridium curvatum]|uniref:Uncharacterized protein n=1 Tax=Thyridium curvatum TaxID=1093900 RepID=A0A507B8N6_9PEZI|nr:uncharacterized protein E0L32_000387 [Thyridium curvatum]TPX16053.1 hypothetical protein E0L32_000387 [Thyridium curvatum]